MKIKLVILFIIIINLKKEINSQLNGIRGNGAPGGDGGTGIIGTPGGGNGQQGLSGGNGGNGGLLRGNGGIGGIGGTGFNLIFIFLTSFAENLFMILISIYKNIKKYVTQN